MSLFAWIGGTIGVAVASKVIASLSDASARASEKKEAEKLEASMGKEAYDAYCEQRSKDEANRYQDSREWGS